MYRGGLDFMRFSVSDTAEWGDYTSGPRIIDASVKARMKEVLTEIQDGTFAKRWIAEDEAGRPEYKRLRAANSGHPIEKVGKALRQLKLLALATIVSEEISERCKLGFMQQ
jgi:ketol-acid reductoisomerase